MIAARQRGKGFELRWHGGRKTAHAVALGAVIALAAPRVSVSSPVQLNPVEIDPPTLTVVGFALPFTGDVDLDASAQVEYRVRMLVNGERVVTVTVDHNGEVRERR